MPKGNYTRFDAHTAYPAEARALGIEGVIRIRLVVDEDGTVTSRVLLNKLGHGLDELAMKRAAEMKFEAARDTDDKPITFALVWTIWSCRSSHWFVRRRASPDPPALLRNIRLDKPQIT